MNEKFNFELTIEETNKVVAGLGKLPAEQSFNLIIYFQNQLEAQSRTEQEVISEPEKAE